MIGAPVEIIWLFRHREGDVVRRRADASDVRGNLILQNIETAKLLRPGGAVVAGTTKRRDTMNAIVDQREALGDLNWATDPAVLFGAQPPTAVFLCTPNQLCVRQQGGPMDESDALVTFNKGGAVKLIEALQAIVTTMRD